MADLQVWFPIGVSALTLLAGAGFAPKAVKYLRGKRRKKSLADRNEDFVGRKKQLAALREAFKTNRIVALAGLGGVGKTQIALEYAHRNLTKYPCAVWWVHASTVLADCRALLLRFGYPDDMEHYKEQLVQPAMQSWYRDHTGWLLIFDNAEDYAALQPWLPEGGAKGHVLLTTRDAKAFPQTQPVDLNVFPEEEALQFLHQRGLPAGDTAKKLAALLGYLPLALEQAAAYINVEKISCEKYIELLQRNGLKLLKKGAPPDHEEAVNVTWQITMERLPIEARQLLDLCACLAPENIPIELFRAAAEEDKLPPSLQPLRDKLTDEVEHNEPLHALTRYSLLRPGKGDGLYSMHRLVQLVVRSDLHDNALLAAAVEIILAALPDEYAARADFDRFASLADHAAAALEFAEVAFADDTELLKKVDYWPLAFGYRLSGDYAAALPYYKRDVSIAKKVYGPEDTNTAATYNNLGTLYNDMGDYDKALEMYQKALAIKEKVFGKEHPSTAGTYDNLGNLYGDMGDYDKALEMHQKALAIREKVLGTEHPDTAATYNNLGYLYYEMKQPELGLPLLLRAYKVRLRVLGERHPHTQTAWRSLRDAFVAAGHREEDFAGWLAQQLREKE